MKSVTENQCTREVKIKLHTEKMLRCMEGVMDPYSLILTGLSAWGLICTGRKSGIAKAGLCVASSAVSCFILQGTYLGRWAAVPEMALQKLFTDNIQQCKSYNNIISFSPVEECVFEANLMLDPIFPTLFSYCPVGLKLVSWILFRGNECKDALRSSSNLPQL